jgi:hypothetical protein
MNPGSPTDTPNRQRRAPITPIEKDSLGRPLCRECREVIPKGRRAYCSDPCHWNYIIRHSPEFAAAMFRQKYGTRCAGCGRDEEPLRSAWESAYRILETQGGLEYLLPFKPFPLDHVRPVSDGGGSCGLENYRLLCPKCHTGITATFNRDRAARKRETGPWKAVARAQAGYRVPLPERP